jgi:hypothetical protein
MGTSTRSAVVSHCSLTDTHPIAHRRLTGFISASTVITRTLGTACPGGTNH